MLEPRPRTNNSTWWIVGGVLIFLIVACMLTAALGVFLLTPFRTERSTMRPAPALSTSAHRIAAPTPHPLVIIATPEHTARIESCLRERGLDTDALKRLGYLATFDAHETLQLFMRDGMPNPGAFRRSLGEILTAVRHGRERRAIRAYGEMVNLLWKDGREAAAIRLETLWNQLAGTHDFDLLCAYSMGNFYKGAALDEIKSRHSHVVSNDGDVDTVSVSARSA